MTYSIKDILRFEVAPALGCTEPSAVALCAAAAASLLKEKDGLQSLEILVDPNIFKNGMAVAIPGCNGLCGIDMAALLGAIGGDPYRKLEVLEPVSGEHIRKAEVLRNRRAVSVEVRPATGKLYIRARIRTSNEEAEAVIENLHDRITFLKLDGSLLPDHKLLCIGSESSANPEKIEEWLRTLTLEGLVSLLQELDEEDEAFLMEGVRFNTRLAEHGLAFASGMGVGAAFERLVCEGLLKKDMVLAARILTSGASDARMGGVKLPAMSSAGSGNHGLTAILPIWAVKSFIEVEDGDRVMKAIALSHLVTAYIKAHTGRLSALCGCSVAAGAGATAGITYLMGGSVRHMASAIKNLVSDLAGVICDGAKAACSLKLATAAGTAVQSALFSLHGVGVQPTDGIIALTPEGTMKNIGTISTEGMIEMDRTVLKIMLEKQFDGYVHG
ncbi:MAG: serine dehydratase subunit alpha family protein [Spirochaetae bacterium HGW-Spirochaetae-1]|jgi:L-cysteine desulfidase|nr:MAG: serine dehydratase subunit alpha family protein [Spirochaetae bacterium HGW-Spirochaetae-1]